MKDKKKKDAFTGKHGTASAADVDKELDATFGKATINPRKRTRTDPYGRTYVIASSSNDQDATFSR